MSQVDSELNRICMEKQLALIDHSTISHNELNGKKLKYEINWIATKITARNLIKYIYDNLI